MENLLALIAILPGVSLAGLIWYLDKKREDPRTLIGTFFLGGIIVVPALLVQNQSVDWGLGDTSSILFALLFAFIIIALTEEAVKYLVLRFWTMPKTFVDEPMDGIVYSAMLGMGFATIENIFYTVTANIEFGLGIGLFRMFTAVPAHAAFSVIMGYYLGKAKFDKINRKILLTKAFAIPFALHGLYDFFVVQQSYEFLSIGIFVALIGAIVLAVLFIKKTREEVAEQEELDTPTPTTAEIQPKQEEVPVVGETPTQIVPEEANAVPTSETEQLDNELEGIGQNLSNMQEDLEDIEEDLKKMKENLDEMKEDD